MRVFVFVAGLVLVAPVHAYQTILDEWRSFYPDSDSDDVECRLCHVNPTGNSPWNAYGIQIRNVLEGLSALGGGATPTQLQEAFEIAETENSDADPSGATSLAEISKSYQPGWTEGANNTITFVDNNNTKTKASGQPPPTISNQTTQIDPAVPISNPLPTVSQGELVVDFITIADGFTSPVMASPAEGLPGFLFVVEQTGKVWQVDLTDGSKQLFIDVGPLLIAGNGERGLLGLAFHPNYISNGLFYTYQSEPTNGQPPADFTTMPAGQFGDHQTVISEWTVNDPANNPFVLSTRRVLFRIEQPQANHNGGMLAFGPDDFLYISLGDGGAADDQGSGHGVDGNSRDNTNPLGAILRIDPLGVNSNNGQYGIPADNPFDGQNGLAEIYAYGFRNPYRFSFDRLCFEAGQSCNTLMLGDVGQREVEEINSVVSGGNYGWNWKEGSLFFYPPTASIYGGGRYISDQAPPSLPDDLMEPIAEYSSDDGHSAIGGFVYRGSSIPEFNGRYIFADYFNRLFYLNTGNKIKEFKSNTYIDFNIAGFAEDLNKDLYIVTRTNSNGALMRLVAGEIDDSFCVPVIASSDKVAIICL
ncbi:MAG: PQQ-dependent sugar dehydrogenase [Acidiferrobacterales bacterium]|nr:PQQ-dependent sugar dehydrogenase [Acidiferrobacterales bacterium]